MKKIKDINTTEEHFSIFKTECKKWIKKLELNDWKIYYIHEDLGPNLYGRCFTDLVGKVCSIRFAAKWAMLGIDDIEESIKETAKHEVIHLLLGRFSTISAARYITESEQIEAEETLVRKLEKLL